VAVNIWPSPAKLNLFLHILGRREDGYHELQTVFQLLEFGDELEIEDSMDDRIVLCGNNPGIRHEDDLIYRAATQLKAVSGTKRGAMISVNKRIPLGGGLGGGSSNAATTLLALNETWDTGLSVHELAALGLRLGADVPVFIHGHSAWAEGVGDRLQTLVLPEQWFMVIHPGIRVDTKKIFKLPDLTRNTSPITIRDFDSGDCHNDCEAVVYREFPQIAGAADWLGQWTKPRLTGTGACVFGCFASKHDADRVLNRLPDKWRGFVSRGINRSPVLDKLELTQSS
jgi:4-diphosphocytidyl-2-C-methyl-D-erythritol kinase